MNKFYIKISLIFFAVGSIIFLYFNEILIINFPKKELERENIEYGHKKNIFLYFWKNDKWNKENIDILWINDLEKNIYQITNQWLNILDEEKITNKKISLQSALIENNNLYLSFDSSLFSENFSTFKKLMIIESLLKTFNANKLEISQVYFLVHHEILDDHHLDFSNPWPLSGFSNASYKQ